MVIGKYKIKPMTRLSISLKLKAYSLKLLFDPTPILFHCQWKTMTSNFRRWTLDFGLTGRDSLKDFIPIDLSQKSIV
jgi:hypothetical protein